MDPVFLHKGLPIMIERSDGRQHQAIVEEIDHQLSCVRVQWMETNETKGKEIDFAAMSQLNPNVVIDVQKTTKNLSFSGRRSTRLHSNIPEKLSVPNEIILTSCKKQIIARNSRIQSAYPRLSQINPQRISSSGNFLKELEKMKKKGPQSVIENNHNSSECKTLQKANKLEKARIERRKQQAVAKAEKTEQLKMIQINPHYQLEQMIRDYCKTINFKPLSNDDTIEDHLITVAVRKRPLNKKDIMQKELDIVTIPTKNQLIVHEPKSKVDTSKYLENHTFKFDYTFSEKCPNEMVYKYTAQPLVQTILNGGFATCFAYGQTGSGKTYTMSGTNEENGIYALTVSDIFKHKSPNVFVSCSFFEIYSKKVFDLLNKKADLKILEDARQQIQIVGLTERVVNSVNEVLKLIECGNMERASGQTSANTNSSRSHAIFQIYLRTVEKPNQLYGKFSLIDLAGNERGADTFLSAKTTRLEGADINQSLLALKECIRALGRKDAHLPFRASKLTQVLRDSFVGNNSRTCMIAMVSPGVGSCENTLNTLRYADRVKELGSGDVQQNSNRPEFVEWNLDVGNVKKSNWETVNNARKKLIEKLRVTIVELEEIDGSERSFENILKGFQSILKDSCEHLVGCMELINRLNKRCSS